MPGLHFSSVAFVGSLVDNPHKRFGRFLVTSFKFPALPGVKTIAFYIRRGQQLNDSGAYLLDNRPDGGFFLSQDRNSVTGHANGVDITAIMGLAAVSTLAWVKVSLQATSFPEPYLFSRFTLDGKLGNYDISSLRTYSRALTAAEAADGTGPFPADSMVSRYDFSLATASAVPDTLTGAYPLILYGDAGTSFTNG